MRCLLVFALVVLASQAIAQDNIGKRVALIIGNGGYERPEDRLPNPTNDADAMAAKLDALGFEVIKALDQDYRGMREALRRFDRLLQDADAGLFFYAGHGMEFRGRNYLFPTDAVLESEGDVSLGLIDVGQVLHVMESRVATRLIFLDACRDNPFARRFRSSLSATRSAQVGTGLARIDAGIGTFIAYSTAPGELAEDGRGDNSPFSSAMLQHLDEPGLDVSQLMRRVRNTVLEATGERQIPWNSSSLRGPFVLNPAPAIGEQPEIASVVPTQTDIDEEREAWSFARELGTIQAFRAYLGEYCPDGRFCSLAEAAIASRENLSSSPNEPAVANPLPSRIENALGLSQQQRRKLQYALKESGHDPGGIDGVFGPRSREAISAWQRSEDEPATGYLTKAQVALLLNSLGPELEDFENPNRPVEVFKDCDHCPEMVTIPAGTFFMGSKANETGRNQDETPQFEVEISSFAISKYEITVKEFRRFVEESGHKATESCHVWSGSEWRTTRGRSWQSPGYQQSDDHPVTCLGFQDAKAYTEWLGAITRRPYYLPSEAQWEYAARAGTTTAYSFGATITEKDANFGFNIGSAAPVGSYPANAFGLHDMHGNLYEMLDDCYSENYLGAPTDGRGRYDGDCGKRVIRGGSWWDAAINLRSASRGDINIDHFRGGDSIGIRVARRLSR